MTVGAHGCKSQHLARMSANMLNSSPADPYLTSFTASSQNGLSITSNTTHQDSESSTDEPARDTDLPRKRYAKSRLSCRMGPRITVKLADEAQALHGIDVFHSSCKRNLLMGHSSFTHKSQSFFYLTVLGVTDERFEIKDLMQRSLCGHTTDLRILYCSMLVINT